MVSVAKKMPQSKSSDNHPVSNTSYHLSLVNYLERMHVIPDEQLGFRNKKSTIDQMLQILNDWTVG